MKKTVLGFGWILIAAQLVLFGEDIGRRASLASDVFVILCLIVTAAAVWTWHKMLRPPALTQAWPPEGGMMGMIGVGAPAPAMSDDLFRLKAVYGRLLQTRYTKREPGPARPTDTLLELAAGDVMLLLSRNGVTPKEIDEIMHEAIKNG